MDFNEWLTAKGFDPSTISESGRQTLEAAWRAESAEKLDPADATPSVPTVSAATQDLDKVLDIRRKENARVEDITRLVSKAIDTNPATVDAVETIGRTAIEQKWTTQKTELELLRAVRPGTQGIFVQQEPDVSARVLEAAVCRMGGLDNLEKHYDDRTLSAVDRTFKGGVGLNDLLMISARRNGFRSASTSVKSNIQGVLRAAFNANDNYNFAAGIAGPSTYTLPQILSNVANKFLKVSFDAVDAAWRSFSAIRAVSDFKQTTTIALTGDMQYAAVPRGGEIKHTTMGETYYNNQADTYGRLLGIDRRDIINDDLGALTGASRRLGRGAALGFNDRFWTVFLNNTGSFFTSGNSNVSTGGGSALSTADGAAINAAEIKFMNQTDPDGKPLGVMPKIMLVPPTLRNTAARWMGSQLFVGSTGLGDANIFGGRFTVVSSPYMENSSYTGYSAAAWYLLADPNDMPVIESVFLNGQQNPTVETSELDWNTLGVALRGYFDYGVALQEYRGGVRSAGS